MLKRESSHETIVIVHTKWWEICTSILIRFFLFVGLFIQRTHLHSELTKSKKIFKKSKKL